MITFEEGNIFEGMCDVICHQVNCRGVMGSGIAKEVRWRFPEVYKKFRETYSNKMNVLGEVDIISVAEGHRFIVNMYAQDNYLPRGIRHTDYWAFEECVRKMKDFFYERRKEISIGFPYNIGCGLGGGDWSVIKRILEKYFNNTEWDIVIWKLVKR